MSTENHASSFDEKAALAELERLQQAIADSRRRRGETVDEFDAFVRSFSNPQERRAPAADRPGETRPVAPAPPSEQVRFEHIDPAALRIELPRPDLLEPIETPGKRPSIAPPWLLAAIAVLVVIGALMLMRGRPSTPAQSPTPAATETTAPAAATASVSTPARAGSAPAVKPGGIQAELTALRPVWVRVLTDGQRAIERELKANERIPVRADQTLTIRVGDAGALRVSIGGKDQGPLGRDGVIANRTFTARRTPSR
jgi:hypothetical protein